MLLFGQNYPRERSGRQLCGVGYGRLVGTYTTWPKQQRGTFDVLEVRMLFFWTITYKFSRRRTF